MDRKGAKRIPLQSSIIGLLLHRRYTTQSLHSCMRTCPLYITSVLLSAPMMCTAPLTLPHSKRLSVIDFIVIVANNWARVVVIERSITLC